MIYRISVTLAALLFPLCSANSLAQHTASLADQYIRSDFTVEAGLSDNVVNAIVQTRNGLLWVGTQAGLATFDGRTFHNVHFRSAGSEPQGAVHCLLVASDGDLWIGTDAGVVRLPRKGLDDPDATPSLFFPLGIGKSDEVETLLQTHDGALWVGTAHGLYRLEGKAFVSVLAGPYVSRLRESLQGTVLVVTSESLLEFDGHNMLDQSGINHELGVANNELFDVLQDRTGATWYNTKKGVRRQREGRISALEPSDIGSVPSERTYEDPDGNIWISTGIGVYKVDRDQLESTGADVTARCMFVSLDGVLWIGTNGNGLVRLRRRVVHMFSKADGLPRNVVMAVLPSHDGRLWVGSNCGLSVFDGQTFTSYDKPDGLANTCVWSLAEDQKHAIWIGTYGGGLFRFVDGHFTQYSIKEGLISNIVFDVKVAQDNSVWVATPDGLSHLTDGMLQNYTTADGLSSNRILRVHEDRDHSIWTASQRGIDRLLGGRFVPFSSTSRDNDQLVNNFAEDSIGHLYAIDTTAGAHLVEGGHLQSVDADMNLMEMAESVDHKLWFSSRHGIFGFARDAFSATNSIGDPPLGFNSIDSEDGLSSIQCSGGSPNIAITGDQKLWVATVKGLAMIDLTHWPGPSQRPQVFLQKLLIDGKEVFTGEEVVLPSGNHRVEFHMAAVDLASPEKIRLQYRMDGVDGDWNDGDASRTAVYTNIPAGVHTLLVRATDSNGQWDRAGRAYRITQIPLFYQTNFFMLLCVCLTAVMLSILYLARVRHLIRHTQTLLEERISERERIASDLHDTFFQGIQGLLLRFNTATAQLSPNEPAKKILMETLEQSDSVMLEGRQLVMDLHSEQNGVFDLARSLVLVGEQFASQGRPKYQVLVLGRSRPLHPARGIELYRLGTEAVHNAFQHANASAIEVEILYEHDSLILSIRDDGQGIDEEVIREGLPGHLGLPGMKKRAQRMGAALSIWSKRANGTEVVVRVPAGVAYFQPDDIRSQGWFARRLQSLLRNRP